MLAAAAAFLFVALAPKGCKATAAAGADCRWDEESREPMVDCNLRILDFRRNSSDVPGIKSAIKMRIQCSDVFFFESQLRSDHLGSLNQLRQLEISYCKIRQLPPRSFVGLTRLRKLSIHTHNSDWTSLSLQPDYEALVGLDLLETLDLSDNNMQLMPAGLLCPLVNIKTVNVSHNSIKDLMDLGLDGGGGGGSEVSPLDNNCQAPVGLETLIVTDNGLTTATPGALATLKKLKELNLARNRLGVLVQSTFDGLSKLESLDLSFNKLAALPPNIFNATPKLTTINLANNSIGTLDIDVFKGLSELQLLNLSGNSLDENWIKPGIFSGLERLVVLDLSSNHMSRIDSGLLQDLYALQVLDLGHNHIHTVTPSGAFLAQKNLHILVLAHNQLEMLEHQTLSGLHVLHSLALHHNKLHSLHQSSLKNCTALEKLSLNNNFLTEIPKAIHSMPNLKNVDLSANVIGVFKRESLQGLPKLKALKLSQNELSRIGEGAFKEAPNLQHLDFSANRFLSLDQDTFTGLNDLQSLNLAENQIEDINGLLTSQANLKWLNLSQNHLAWFDYAFIPPVLEWLDIHDNGVDSLGNYYALRDNYALKYIDARQNKITGLEVLSVLPSVEELRLQDNMIGHIAANTFLGKPNLTAVHLQSNRLSTLEMASLMVSISPTKEPPKIYLANNPLVCDCRLSWLKQLHPRSGGGGGLSGDPTVQHALQYPEVADLDQASCAVVNQTDINETYNKSVVRVQPDEFLCRYTTHCLTLCMCCEYLACDCQMTCPDGCNCFHDSSWNANIVQCSNGDHSKVSPLVPMDATALHLDGNNLTTLRTGMFLGRNRLKKVYLNRSKVSKIQNQTFAGLSELRLLDLSYNELTQLYGFEFEGLSMLRELYLQHNKLVSIADRTFKGLKQLSALHLDSNLLIAFPVWELGNAGGRLSQLTLSSNWWQCECEFVRKFRVFIDDNIEAIPDANNIKCTSSQLGGGLGKGQQCTELMSSNYHSQVLGENFVPVLIGIVVLSLTLVIVLVAIYRLRDSFRIWLHAKYGYRLCLRKSKMKGGLGQQQALNKSSLSVGSQNAVLFEAVVLYSQKDDHNIVGHLANQLEPEYRLYMHHRDTSAGIYTSEAFKSALTASLSHIVVLSQAFLTTEWEQVKELVLTNCIVIISDDVTREDILRNADLHKFIKLAKHSINWNDGAFWRKLRYYLPDPVEGNKRLVQASKMLAKEAGAELDVSGVWTFTPTAAAAAAASDYINESGNSTAKLLLPQSPSAVSECPTIPLNNPNSGSTTMLALLRAHANGGGGGSNGHITMGFPAPPVKKKHPHQFGAGGSGSTHSVLPPDGHQQQSFHHQRSRSQDPEMTLGEGGMMPMTRSCGTNAVHHQRSRSAVAKVNGNANGNGSPVSYVNNEVRLNRETYRQYQSQAILRENNSPVYQSNTAHAHLRSASHVLPGTTPPLTTRQSPIGAVAAAAAVTAGHGDSPAAAAAASRCHQQNSSCSLIHQLAVSSPDPDLLSTVERHQRRPHFPHLTSDSPSQRPSNYAKEISSPQRTRHHLYAKHGRSTSTVVPMTASSQSPVRQQQQQIYGAASGATVHQRSRSQVVDSNQPPQAMMLMNVKQLSREAIKQYKSTTNLVTSQHKSTTNLVTSQSSNKKTANNAAATHHRSTSNLSTIHQRSSSSPCEGFVL